MREAQKTRRSPSQAASPTKTDALEVNEFSEVHADMCQALADAKRIRILYAIDEQPRHVTALARDLGLPQPTVSRHLRVLRQRCLVRGERDGSAVVYHLADPRVIEALDTMQAVTLDAVDRLPEH
jgi:DNA-binding transcriptional ArsR family regulator